MHLPNRSILNYEYEICMTFFIYLNILIENINRKLRLYRF